MTGKLVCWRCGEPLGEIERPFPRLAKCQACEAELHVCRMCEFYKPSLSTRCDHELAEPAREVDLANFCHYLKLKPDAYGKSEHSRAKDAAEKLNALFGDDETTNNKIKTDKGNVDPLSALFKDND